MNILKMVDISEALASVEKLMEKVEKEEKVSVEEVVDFAKKLYDGLVKNFRPLIHAVPPVADDVAKDAAPLVVTLFKLVNGIGEDKDFNAELARQREQTAERRRAAIVAYTTAGFSHDEAFSLLLMDVANTKESRAAVIKGINEMRNSRSSGTSD